MNNDDVLVLISGILEKVEMDEDYKKYLLQYQSHRMSSRENAKNERDGANGSKCKIFVNT